MLSNTFLRMDDWFTKEVGEWVQLRIDDDTSTLPIDLSK